MLTKILYAISLASGVAAIVLPNRYLAFGALVAATFAEVIEAEKEEQDES